MAAGDILDVPQSKDLKNFLGDRNATQNTNRTSRQRRHMCINIHQLPVHYEQIGNSSADSGGLLCESDTEGGKSLPKNSLPINLPGCDFSASVSSRSRELCRSVREERTGGLPPRSLRDVRFCNISNCHMRSFLLGAQRAFKARQPALGSAFSECARRGRGARARMTGVLPVPTFLPPVGRKPTFEGSQGIRYARRSPIPGEWSLPSTLAPRDTYTYVRSMASRSWEKYATSSSALIHYRCEGNRHSGFFPGSVGTTPPSESLPQAE